MNGRRGSERDLVEEVDFLKEDRRLKDDTIEFLQHEKESLVQEIKHYESMNARVETDIATRMRQEEMIKELKIEINQLKQALADQRQRMRALRENKPLNNSQQTLVEDVSKRAMHLLVNCGTDRGNEVRDLIESMDKHGDSTSLPWDLLDLINKSLAEVIQLCFRLEKRQPKYRMRYTNVETPQLPMTAPPNQQKKVGEESDVNIRKEANPIEFITSLSHSTTPAYISSEPQTQPSTINSMKEPPVFMRFTHRRSSDRARVEEHFVSANPLFGYMNSDPHGISTSSKLMKQAKNRLDVMNKSNGVLSRMQTAPENERFLLPNLRRTANLT